MARGVRPRRGPAAWHPGALLQLHLGGQCISSRALPIGFTRRGQLPRLSAPLHALAQLQPGQPASRALNKRNQPRHLLLVPRQVQVWKWWKDAAQEARQARFAAQAADRRMALERPGSAQAAAVQLQLGSERAPCAAGACEGAEQEAWKAELQVGSGRRQLQYLGRSVNAALLQQVRLVPAVAACTAPSAFRWRNWRGARLPPGWPAGGDGRWLRCHPLGSMVPQPGLLCLGRLEELLCRCAAGLLRSSLLLL